jgi:hypothetical protein
MLFTDLGLSESILRAISEEGYTSPTPIQAKSIPAVLKGGDLLAAAQTGTGKTAGFTLPILQRLSSTPQTGGKRQLRVLILTPTRELAAQVQESVVTYGKYTGLKSTVIFGGVGANPQIKAIAAGLDILVATPGRLLDLMSQNCVSLAHIEILVLDDESSSETYRKIESLCEKYSAKLMRISRPNKRTVADVGLLLDLGIENVKTKYVCMLDADTIHLTSDVYDQLLPLLRKRTVVSVGLDTGLGSSYHQNSSWGHVKDLFPYDISYPKQQTVTNNLFRIMRTADALSVARTAKFSRQVENRKLRDQFGRVLRRVSNSTNFSWLQDRVKGFLLSPVLNSHYPSMPPTGDNGVSANYWMEANGMGRKVNIPITSFGFRSASDGICFQNVSDLIVHVALSTRALSTERREISDAGVEFYEAVQNIVEATKSEEELFEEILSRSRKIAIDLTQ